MIKNVKRLLVFSVCALVLPLCVKAENEEYLRFSCTKTELAPGETTTCSIGLDVTGTEITVDSFTATVRVYENDGTSQTQKLTLSDFEFDSNKWSTSDSSADNGDYVLVIKENVNPYSGNIEIGSFNVTAGNSLGIAKIGLKNISFGTVSNEINSDSVFVQINVVSASGDNTNTGTNTGTDDNTNTNTGNGEDTNNNTTNNSSSNDGTSSTSDVSKTESKAPENPVTGVTLSALGIALLVVGSISYITLRKKNYFNKL